MSDATPPPASPEPSYTPPPAATPAYSAPAAGAPAKTNTLAIVGLILAFVFSLAGLIVSIIARGQIKRTGEGGAGLALAGIIISIVGIVIGAIVIIANIALFAALSSSGYSTY